MSKLYLLKLSRTNLLYMRAFAEAYSEEQIVQQVVGQTPWGYNLAIVDEFKPEYAEKLNFYLSAVEDLRHQPNDELETELGAIGLGAGGDG